MWLMKDLSYIFERSRSAYEITPIQTVDVKGENYILAVLRRNSSLFNELAINYPELADIEKSILGWIPYLDRKYTEASSRVRLFGGPYVLDVKDAENLSKDVQNWMNEILKVYGTPTTVHIAQSFDELFPENLLANYDDLTINDLTDAFICIVHEIPTPAVMISFRAAENIVRKLYETITGKSGFKTTWNNINQELRTNATCPKPLIGLLDYIRNKRNEAEHPDIRYTQDESERILLQIKNLMEECNNIK